MSAPVPETAFPRLAIGGKWLREGTDKWRMKGVSYGPFKPNTRGEPYPEDEQLRHDLEHLSKLGFNTVRLYELPTLQVIETASRLGLRLLVGIPWTDHVDFLRDSDHSRTARRKILDAVRRLKDVPAIAAFLIGNEIEKTLVRWMGPARVRAFLEDLIESCREIAPQSLFSYATYPSTEYLIPRNADFLSVNVYLEQQAALSAYLQRLHNLAGDKPLVITEFGLDVAAHGEDAQRDTRSWFEETCERSAVAGTVWFSYTDEWFRGGEEVTQWQFGLVDAQRRERPAAHVLQQVHDHTPERPGALPRISVIVCTYNGTSTLRACLESLGRLRYPDYETLLIDDGSTLDIEGIAREFAYVRYVRQEHAGLSVARNLGASLATGEIVAYTDDDCIADEDWLAYLATGFDDPQWVAAGGPNIPPPPRNRTEAVVAAAPGAPAHVLLTDIEAEHLPGCNLAIRKSALEAIGGFRAQYRAAGDDVDVCWRLREAGGRMRFVPGAMVWHHRRYTIRAYLRQQKGYGHAEALLMKDHPERFGPLGGARWFGGIYGDRASVLILTEGNIFHGPMGEGLFQGIYRQWAGCWLDWMGGLAWVMLVVIALACQAFVTAGVIFGLSSLLASCRLLHLTHAPFVLKPLESCLLLGLCWIQPVLREWKRVSGMFSLGARPGGKEHFRHAFTPPRPRKLAIPLGEMEFWSETGVGRATLLEKLKARLYEQHIPFRTDDGWRLLDIEAQPQADISPAFITVTEYHWQKRQFTRARLMLRIRLTTLVLTLLILALLLASGYTRWVSPAIMVPVQAVMLLTLALLLSLWRKRWLRKITQAARDASLLP